MHGAMVRILCGLVLIAWLPALATAERRPFTVADGIETTRVMGVYTSPALTQFAVLLVRGDLARDGVWLTIVAGKLASVAEASRAGVVASLFTRSLGGDIGPPYITVKNVVSWVGESRIAILWPDSNGIQQVHTVDLATGTVQPLTSHPANVLDYAIHPGGALFYSAERSYDPAESRALIENGFAVRNEDAYSLMDGNADGRGRLEQAWEREFYFSAAPGRAAQHVSFGNRAWGLWSPRLMSFSPDGRWLLLDTSPETIPPDWRRYDSADYVSQGITEALGHGRAGFMARQVSQLFVLDTERLTSRSLWSVPSAHGITADWAPDGRTLIVGHTFLPAGIDDRHGTDGNAVAEINVTTGVVRARSGSKSSIGRTSTGNSRVGIEVRQDMNSPPVVFAFDRKTGESRRVLDPNPALLSRFTLGQVKTLQWSASDGVEWRGLLYLPVGYAAGERYPLVVQTHGYAPPDTFSLYGKGPDSPGLGPAGSIYAAQALANRGIAVLQMQNVTDKRVFNTPAEAQTALLGIEGAIRHLVSQGVVDENRVALAGYSRTGWHVAYALTHSTFAFAAAITADNFDGSYMQSLLTPGTAFDGPLGAAPFGEGLRIWLANAPGFNAEKIRAPLRLQVESGGLSHALASWELFSRLKRLGKPVELYVIPRVGQGSHLLQNPRQVLASKEGAVDWFDFWLNHHEDTAASKAPQYERWRALRSELMAGGN